MAIRILIADARALNLNGSLDVESTPAQGTKIRARIPVTILERLGT